MTALALLAGLALGGCVARTATVEPAPPQAVLRWQARNETGVYGYLVFRADNPEGPFLRSSAEIVHVAAEGAEVRSYTWVDRDVQPGRTYYYALDIVQNNGRKRRFSGVVAKTVSR